MMATIKRRKRKPKESAWKLLEKLKKEGKKNIGKWKKKGKR